MTSFINILDIPPEKDYIPNPTILLEIENATQALSYVDDIIHNLSHIERKEFVGIYLGNVQINKRKRNPTLSRQHGGEIKCDDEENINIYKLLSTMDTVHDICHRPPDGDWEYGLSPKQVFTICNCIIPDGLKNLTAMGILEFLCRTPIIRFGRAAVSNPLFSCGIDNFSGTRHKSVKAYAHSGPKSSSNERNTYLCIIHENQIDKKISAKQVILLISAIKNWYNKYNEPVFQLDNYSPITKLFASLKLIDEAWFRRITDGTLSLKEFKSQIPVKHLWKSYVTDAKLFDGMEHQTGTEYDDRPTGWVFRNEINGNNICLNGIDQNYRIVFKCNNKTIAKTRQQAEREHTTNILFSGKQTLEAIMYKRCGDWGQVEHCKRYGKIFVTEDRFAAMYAYYRKVDFILTSQIINKKYIETGTGDEWVQFTFVLSRAP